MRRNNLGDAKEMSLPALAAVAPRHPTNRLLLKCVSNERKPKCSKMSTSPPLPSNPPPLPFIPASSSHTVNVWLPLAPHSATLAFFKSIFSRTVAFEKKKKKKKESLLYQRLLPSLSLRAYLFFFGKKDDTAEKSEVSPFSSLRQR